MFERQSQTHALSVICLIGHTKIDTYRCIHDSMQKYKSDKQIWVESGWEWGLWNDHDDAPLFRMTALVVLVINSKETSRVSRQTC